MMCGIAFIAFMIGWGLGLFMGYKLGEEGV